jgi:hypothetical protein
MKLVRESINEKFKEKSDPIKDMGISLKDEEKWAHEMVSALENHKVTQFGGSIPVENAKIEFVREGSVDVTGSIQANAKIRFNLYFGLRDVRNWSDPEPKWSVEVSISSPSKRGYFTKNATGKNTTPTKLLELLSNIFDLKFRRR